MCNMATQTDLTVKDKAIQSNLKVEDNVPSGHLVTSTPRKNGVTHSFDTTISDMESNCDSSVYIPSSDDSTCL